MTSLFQYDNLLRMINIKNLDFLRAYAVGLVVFAHLWRYLGDHLVFGKFEISHHFGILGVLLFFVHTSLVLMFSLERQIHKSGYKNLISKFYIRRVFRIYPLSIFCTVIYMLFTIPGQDLSSYSLSFPKLYSFETLVSNLLLFTNFYKKVELIGPLWSLPYEIQMYVFLPFLFFLINKKNGILYLLFLIFITSLLSFYCTPLINEYNLSFEFYQIPKFLLYVPCFLPGIMAYYFYKKNKLLLNPGTLPILLLTVSIITLFTYKPYMDYLVCFSVGLIIPFIKPINISLLNKITFYIAQYSYGIYLSHIFCIWISFELLKEFGFTTKICIFFLLLSIISSSLFHFIERPFMNFAKKQFC